jgi:hypothetical protein
VFSEVFQSFYSSNLENKFQNFLPRKKIEKCVSKYLFKGKQRRLGSKKETWEVGRKNFIDKI